MTRQQEVCQYHFNKGQEERIICDANCSREKQAACTLKAQIDGIHKHEDENKFVQRREDYAENKGE